MTRIATGPLFVHRDRPLGGGGRSKYIATGPPSHRDRLAVLSRPAPFARPRVAAVDEPPRTMSSFARPFIDLLFAKMKTEASTRRQPPRPNQFFFEIFEAQTSSASRELRTGGRQTSRAGARSATQLVPPRLGDARGLMTLNPKLLDIRVVKGWATGSRQLGSAE